MLDKRSLQFSTLDYEAMGRSVLDSLLDLCDPNPTKVTRILSLLKHEIALKVQRKKSIPKYADINIDVDQIDSDIDSDPDASDSSDDEPVIVPAAFNNKIPSADPSAQSSTSCLSVASQSSLPSSASKQSLPKPKHKPTSSAPRPTDVRSPKVASRLFYVPERMRPKSSKTTNAAAASPVPMQPVPIKSISIGSSSPAPASSDTHPSSAASGGYLRVDKPKL